MSKKEKRKKQTAIFGFRDSANNDSFLKTIKCLSIALKVSFRNQLFL